MENKQLYFTFAALSSKPETQQLQSEKATASTETASQEIEEEETKKPDFYVLKATDDNRIQQQVFKENDDSQLWYLSPNFTNQSQSGFSIINKKTGTAIKYQGQNKPVILAEEQFGNEDFIWQMQSFILHQWQVTFQDSDYCLTVQDQEDIENANVICKQNQDMQNQQFVLTLSEIDQMQQVQQTMVSVGI